MKKAVQRFSVLPVIVVCLGILFSWQYAQVPDLSAIPNVDSPIVVMVNESIEPLPQQIDLNQDKIMLGNKLFHDPRLSHNNTVACANCHEIANAGIDHRTHSIGIYGREGAVNVPTIFNSGFHFKQFWDGRAETLEAQIDASIRNPLVMDSSWSEILNKLKRSSEYQTAFGKLYSEGITEDSIKNAIVTFERSLYTPNARFDQFLRGNSDALTDEEKAGYRRFKAYGCVSCHQGILLGGNMFQKFGVFGNYLQDRGNITKADLGRFNVTGKEEDRYAFKVPSLRNVALTSPYFHDGSVKTLHEAVKVMIKYQLGREVSQQDVDLIVQFLRTLTGVLAGDF
ncbi:MAG: c-type cytochrome [Cyanobacteria bacterium CRU_2_1]|nr:c-type cytochrome [Cyanobacteria bacterium RU_5_0]NJR61474.1 c-type cytochrome [Cyanobacteria bacterium CRU_2_1]